MTSADRGSDRADRRTDRAVQAALRRIEVPDHDPDFWEHLGRRLAHEAPPGAPTLGPSGNGTGAAPDPWTGSPVLGATGGPAGNGADPGPGPWTGGGDLPPTAPASTLGNHVPHQHPPREGNGARPTAHRVRRSRRPLLAAAAAVVAVAVVAVALLLAPDGDRVEVGPRSTGTTATSAPDPTTLGTGPGPTDPGSGGTGGPDASPGTMPTSIPVTPTPGAEEAVLGFLDALGRGDIPGAASHLGPRSEAYLDATAGSVESFLRQTTEGYGAWGAADRTVTTVPLGPGEVVVVVSGQLAVEGTVEDRSDAFPARYAESAGVWFVEPWALPPAPPGARPPALRTPQGLGAGPATPVARIDQVVATTSGDGAIWLAIDDRAPLRTTVGPDREATWSLPEPLPLGRHTLTVIYQDQADTTFATSSEVFDVVG